MYNKKMYALGSARSAIRELFEYGRARKAEIGDENVFDFSLGNPSTPVPACIDETITTLVRETDSTTLHGYTSALGDPGARAAVAGDLARRYGVDPAPDNVIMTTGAAAALCATLYGICEDGDEFIVISPYFPEYKVFVESAGGTLVPVNADPENNFAPDPHAIAAAITEHTKAVIINSPNNPTGRVYTEDEISAIADVLESASRGREPIFLISDEPYRELIYGGSEYPFVTNIYKNSIVCYSYSKSLSLAGERLGYIYISPECCGQNQLICALAGAARALGYVCAPSLFQKVIAKNPDALCDIRVYDENRRLLCDALWRMGYDFVPPDGAFYLFLKSPIADAHAFFERARAHELLLVPSDSFGGEGYLRISYCVPTEVIQRSLPAFSALAEEFSLKKR